MSYKDRMLVAMLKPPREDLSLEYFSTSLQEFITLKFDSVKNPIKWVFSLSAAQFIVLIDDDDVVRILASETLVLPSADGSVEVKFDFISYMASAPIEYVLVTIKDKSRSDDVSLDILSSLMKKLPVSPPYVVYSRGGNVIVKVPSESGGHDSHGVVDALSAFPQVGGCEILSPSDYIYIEGVYQNSTPNRIGQVGSLRNLIAKISSRGDSLLGVLRSSFSLLEEQPCIVDIVSLFCPTQRAKGREDDSIMFVCASTPDADILLNHENGQIAVGSLGHFCFSDTSLVRECFIQKVSAGSGGINFDALIQNARKSQTNFPGDDSFFEVEERIDTKELSMISVARRSPEINIQLLGILRELYKDSDCAPFFIDTNDARKDTDFNLCTITGWVVSGKYSSFPPFVTDVHRMWCEGKGRCCKDSDVIIIDRLTTYFDELCTLCSKEFGGQHIKDTPVEKEKNYLEQHFPPKPTCGEDSGYNDEAEGVGNVATEFHLNACEGDDFGSATKTPSTSFPESDVETGLSGADNNIILPRDNGISKLPNGCYSKTIRLSKLTMAQHLNQILKWKDGRDGTGVLTDDDPVYGMFAALAVDKCSFEVVIDKNRHKQKVVLSASTVVALRQLSLAVCDVISLLISNRKVHRCSEKWKSEHRDAINDSYPLQEKTLHLRASAVFHFLNGFVAAEIVGATAQGVKKMGKYLHSLQPSNTTWIFPAAKDVARANRHRFWSDVQHKYATKVSSCSELTRNGEQVMKVEVCSFTGGNYLRGAYDALSLAFGPAQATFQGTSKADQSLPEMRSLHSKADFLGPSSTGFGNPYFAMYKFQEKDRHASHFFSSYEQLFKRFFLRKFGVTVTCFCTTSRSVCGSISGDTDTDDKELQWKLLKDDNSGEGGLCILDLRCHSEANIRSVKYYLSHMMEHLAIQHVIFEGVSSENYQRIVDVKQRCISAFLSPIGDGSSCTSKVTDNTSGPLTNYDLVSLRMNPPLLHVQGALYYRHFPVDVVVYICSPTTPSHKRWRHTLSKAKQFAGSFRTLKRAFQRERESGVEVRARHVRVDEVIEDERRNVDIEDFARVRNKYTAERNKSDYQCDVVKTSYMENPQATSEAIEVGLTSPLPGLFTLHMEDNENKIEDRFCSLPKSFCSKPGMTCPMVNGVEVDDLNPSLPTTSMATRSLNFEQLDALSVDGVLEGCLSTPTAPQEVPEWRNTVRICDMTHTLSQQGNQRNIMWENTVNTESHCLISENFNSTHSLDAFVAPRPASSGIERCVMSPAGYDHVADCASLGDDISGHASIIDGINVIIDSEDGYEPMNNMQKAVKSPQVCIDERNSKFISRGGCEPPLSYSEALLAPSSLRLTKKTDVYQRKVQWPHLSFKYMFLAPHMKQRIQSKIKAVEFKYGGHIEVVCPYRDKKDQTACLLISTVSSCDITPARFSQLKDHVETVLLLFNQVLQATLEETQTIQIVLNQTQFDKLTEDTLVTVKFIQGDAGVHILLAEKGTSTGGLKLGAAVHNKSDIPFLTLDWRREQFPSGEDVENIFLSKSVSSTSFESRTMAGAFFQPDFNCRSGGGCGRDIIAVHIPCRIGPESELVHPLKDKDFTPSPFIEVSVQMHESDEAAIGWVWGAAVTSLFAVIDIGDAENLGEEEKRQVLGGDILVTRDDSTATSVILRACPSTLDRKDMCKDELNLRLRHLIRRAICHADRTTLHVDNNGPVRSKGLVIVPPISVPIFSDKMTTKEIEMCCASAVVDYIQTSPIFSLERIVCLEASESMSSESNVAKYLFDIVKRQYERVRSSGADFSHQMRITPFISVCQDAHLKAVIDQYIQFDRGRIVCEKRKKEQFVACAFYAEVPDARRCGTHVVLVRGTAACICAATLLILKHIAPDHCL